MKLIILTLVIFLTGCAGWTPVQQVAGSDGRTYYWIAPLPTGDGPQSSGSRSAGVTTYIGTVNGRGYSVSSFR